MSSIYYPAQPVTNIEECFFYHTVDLANGETVHGNWDLRGREDQYFGGVDFSGKTALDVGCATGSLTFAMEDRGAEVTSLDLGPGATLSRDYVPFAQHDYRDVAKTSFVKHVKQQRSQTDHSDQAQVDLHKIQTEGIRNSAKAAAAEDAINIASAEQYVDSPYEHMNELNEQNRGFWYCHNANGSNAKVVYRSVYEMPREIGPVDVSIFGAILLHVRDPFFALHNGCRLTRETVIITDLHHKRFHGKNHPVAMFVPTPQDKSRIGTFWRFSPEIIVQMLGVLGFEDTEVSFHKQKARGGEQDMFTVVGKRTAPFNSAMTY
ncbi:MAG: SAM-dependent methyltransferase [Sulfitobacter sp.]